MNLVDLLNSNVKIFGGIFTFSYLIIFAALRCFLPPKEHV